MSKTILIQEHLRPALPVVLGCRDYQEQEKLLIRVDRILRESGVERLFVGLSLERFGAEASGKVSHADLVGQSERSERALRCTVLKNLLGEDYREMSVRLAQCELFRWFCKLPELEAVRVPSKSTLQEYANWLPHEEMVKVLGVLRESMGQEERAREIGLQAELEMDVAWVDTTCLKANIHFPVDWVLLRDAVRTCVKAILVIRRHGLKVRMPEPGDFLAAINAQAMAMSAASRRKPGSKKARKQVLRKTSHSPGHRKDGQKPKAASGYSKMCSSKAPHEPKGSRIGNFRLDWAVLSHNLWVVARLPWACDRQMAAVAA